MENQREESDTKESSFSSKLCIFHGFETIYEVDIKECKGQYIMKYTGGNQCGLTGEQCPIRGDGIRWSECPREDKEELIKRLGKARVFPKNQWPEKADSLEGVSLEEWVKYGEEKE